MTAISVGTEAFKYGAGSRFPPHCATVFARIDSILPRSAIFALTLATGCPGYKIPVHVPAVWTSVAGHDDARARSHAALTAIIQHGPGGTSFVQALHEAAAAIRGECPS